MLITTGNYVHAYLDKFSRTPLPNDSRGYTMKIGGRFFHGEPFRQKRPARHKGFPNEPLGADTLLGKNLPFAQKQRGKDQKPSGLLRPSRRTGMLTASKDTAGRESDG